jgi:flagellar biosynthesis/type III secretory pathway protein FliH
MDKTYTDGYQDGFRDGVELGIELGKLHGRADLLIEQANRHSQRLAKFVNTEPSEKEQKHFQSGEIDFHYDNV